MEIFLSIIILMLFSIVLIILDSKNRLQKKTSTLLLEKNQALENLRTEGEKTKHSFERRLEASKDHIDALQENIETLKENHTSMVAQKVKEARADALAKSRSVMRGQATEHLAPIMTSEWSHKDFRFVGNPIDYLLCAGASAVTDKQADAIDEVVLLEVKTGKSQLNKVQRRIRDAVKEGRVSFAVFNPDTGDIRKWKHVQN